METHFSTYQEVNVPAHGCVMETNSTPYVDDFWKGKENNCRSLFSRVRLAPTDLGVASHNWGIRIFSIKTIRIIILLFAIRGFTPTISEKQYNIPDKYEDDKRKTDNHGKNQGKKKLGMKNTKKQKKRNKINPFSRFWIVLPHLHSWLVPTPFYSIINQNTDLNRTCNKLKRRGEKKKQKKKKKPTSRPRHLRR